MPSKSTITDWTSREDDDEYYAENKRPRGGRKKRKKNPHEQVYVAEDWNAPYDPTWPTSYPEYRDGDEKVREVREWKDHLYNRKRSPTVDSDSEDERPRMYRDNHKIYGTKLTYQVNLRLLNLRPPALRPRPTLTTYLLRRHRMMHLGRRHLLVARL